MRADSTDANFDSTKANSFIIRAGGGVGINTNAPTQALDVSGNVRVRGLASPVLTNDDYVVVPDTDYTLRRMTFASVMSGNGYR